MTAASKATLAVLPLLALLAACGAGPDQEGRAVSAGPALSGVLGAPVGVVPAGAPASGSTLPGAPLPAPMSAPEIATTFANNTAEGVSSTGAPYAAYFLADGAERFLSGSFRDYGHWRVLGDGHLCTSLLSLSHGEEVCYVMYRNGTTITFAASDGTAIGSFAIVAGDPMHL